jgi:hypothetical protein
VSLKRTVLLRFICDDLNLQDVFHRSDKYVAWSRAKVGKDLMSTTGCNHDLEVSYICSKSVRHATLSGIPGAIAMNKAKGLFDMIIVLHLPDDCNGDRLSRQGRSNSANENKTEVTYSQA